MMLGDISFINDVRGLLLEFSGSSLLFSLSLCFSFLCFLSFLCLCSLCSLCLCFLCFLCSFLFSSESPSLFPLPSLILKKLDFIFLIFVSMSTSSSLECILDLSDETTDSDFSDFGLGGFGGRTPMDLFPIPAMSSDVTSVISKNLLCVKA